MAEGVCGGAMEVVKVIEEAHEGTIVSLAFNKSRREIFSAADGDKVIKVGGVCAWTWSQWACSMPTPSGPAGVGLPLRAAHPPAAGPQGHGDQRALLGDGAPPLLRLH